ncbi:hypothetical protein [Lentzea sp. NBRC 102530]|uniref:hypothetical protein n=1 Tax=Lentzea sp. NBRC 102530 TaxID=3032201 RepID=UPI0024A09600|nr:hypothetical protein [Lentzea sp. NBRC 102530]MDX3663030.1 hypothetical protein [Streptomyces sp. ID05-26A]GLY55149.1 hypothetical protein Lesp01_88040 [Lentzea sp. NBRC 102530]
MSHRFTSFLKGLAAVLCVAGGLTLSSGLPATAAPTVEYRVCAVRGSDVTAAIVFVRGSNSYDIGAVAKPGTCQSVRRGPVLFEIWAGNQVNPFQKIASYGSGGSQPCVRVWSRDSGRLFVYSLQWFSGTPTCNAG